MKKRLLHAYEKRFNAELCDGLIPHVLLSLVTLAVILAVPCVARAQAPLKVTPFTLKTETIDYSKSPRGKVEARTTIARRADGEEAAIVNGPIPNGFKRLVGERIVSFPDGRRVEVLDLIHAVIDWPKSSNKDLRYRRERMAAENPDCSFATGEYLDAQETLGGVKVDVLKSPPEGSSGSTLWRAPELGCEVLASTYTQVQMDGSFRRVSQEKFLGIRLGEPDASMFDIPADYQKLAPSQARRLECEKLGIPWTKQDEAHAKLEDDLYHGRVPAKYAVPKER